MTCCKMTCTLSKFALTEPFCSGPILPVNLICTAQETSVLICTAMQQTVLVCCSGDLYDVSARGHSHCLLVVVLSFNIFCKHTYEQHYESITKSRRSETNNHPLLALT